MILYDLFNLYLVLVDGIKYICEKTYDDNYREIFTSQVFNNVNKENVQDLEDYYEILAMKSYISGEYVFLKKDELLIKFAELNSYNIYKNNKNNYIDNIHNERKEYLELFNELSKKKPEKAKEIAMRTLERSGMLNTLGEIDEQYKDVLVKKKTL